MKITYKVEGVIEMTLDKEDSIEYNNASDKNAFVKQYFINALDGCSSAGENELDFNVNFNGLRIKEVI